MLSLLLDWVAKYFSPSSLFKHETSTLPLEKEKVTPSINQPSVNSFVSDGLQAEIRAERKFSLAEAIGRESGSFMKGESAIPRPVKAANEIKQFIATHSPDPSGVLATELTNWCIADIRLSRQLETPLVALAQIVESLLNEPTTFYEFARQVAIAQSKVTGDHPYFQQPGKPPDPRADYPHSSIRHYLLEIAAYIRNLIA